MPGVNRETGLQLDSPAGPVDALHLVPPRPRAQAVLAHGAGAGIGHHNMHAIAHAFADAGVASLRFNFPYMQAGRRRVDSKDVAVQTIVSATVVLQQLGDLPTFLSGHSFGGRMCSHAVVEADLSCVGLIFASFPLHPPSKPGVERAAHMPGIQQPVLFISGTRDDLAEAKLLKQTAGQMPDAKIHWLETANHSYVVLKRTRINPLTVFAEMSQAIGDFADSVILTQ